MSLSLPFNAFSCLLKGLKCPKNIIFKCKLVNCAETLLTSTFGFSRITCWKKAWLGWTLKRLEKRSTGCLLSSLRAPPVMSHQRRPIRWHLKKWKTASWWLIQRLVGKQNVAGGKAHVTELAGWTPSEIIIRTRGEKTFLNGFSVTSAMSELTWLWDTTLRINFSFVLLVLTVYGWLRIDVQRTCKCLCIKNNF